MKNKTFIHNQVFRTTIACLSLTLTLTACSAQKSPGTSVQFTPTPPPVTLLTASCMPTTGSVNSLVIAADFQDVKYDSTRLTTAQLKDALFGGGLIEYAPCESLTVYFKRASYGALELSGDVYNYTLSGNIADYEDSEAGYEKVMLEILNGLDDQIDYRNYDSNQDGYIDSLSISVPTGGDTQFWYGCTATWYSEKQPSMDGILLDEYVISDEQPYEEMMDRYIGTLAHEFGHCMGLPDYYLYDTTKDWEGTHGDAGIERMDEASGDFCSFSKLMLGWYKNEQVQTAYACNGKKQTFTLSSDSTDGGCLVIPRYNSSSLMKEYFLVDYVTPEGNYEGLFEEGGIRIYHIDADMSQDEDAGSYLTYESFSQYYDTSHQGKRVIRLVNDGAGFYQTNAVIAAGGSGFAWYAEDGTETIEPGFDLTVGAAADGKCEVTIEWN